MDSQRIDRAMAFMIYVGAIVSALIAVVVIAVPVVAPMVSTTYNIPAEIKEWGGVIIGFYFGSFITLVGNYVKVRLPSKDDDAKPQEPGSK